MKTSTKVLATGLIVTLLAGFTLRADDPVKTPEDLAREAAIADFTAKQEANNWPEKFERIGKEMGVPGNILASIAFAETRWEHLQWPEGETVSPENGMPRPYGVMSLWDNEFFGHSLVEAAKLIGKTPDDLKKDPELNIRGAAALLKKLYADNAKPEGTTDNDIESWRYAMVKYCGIPERDLSHRHALDCYEFMSEGYDQYGMHWKPQEVNLGPMREEVKKIVAEERAKQIAAMTPEQLAGLDEKERPPGAIVAEQPKEIIEPEPGSADRAKFEKSMAGSGPSAKKLPAIAAAATPTPTNQPDWKIWAIVGTCALGLSFFLFKKKAPEATEPKK
jgi:hypothetical protein